MGMCQRYLTGAAVLGNSPSVQQHWVHSTGAESWMAAKIFTSNWSKNEQDHLRGTARKEQTGVQADSAMGSGCSKPTQPLPEPPQVQLHPGDEITVLRLCHQAGGMKVADSTELTLDDPRVSASLVVLCTFLSIHHLQPELSETLVSGAQQGRCKINRIWSAARDLTRLQRLWYFTEAQNKNQLLLLPSVCYCFYLKKKKTLSRTNKTKQRRLILLYFRSKAHSDRLAHWLSICHMLSSFFFYSLPYFRPFHFRRRTAAQMVYK